MRNTHEERLDNLRDNGFEIEGDDATVEWMSDSSVSINPQHQLVEADDEADDGERFLRHITGVLKLEDGREIGRIKLIWIQMVQLMNHHIDPWVACDSESQPTADAYSAIYYHGYARHEFVDDDDAAFDYDILVIDRMEIDPAFRNKGWGEQLLRAALEYYGEGTFVLLKPFPIEFEGKDKCNEQEYRTALKRLKAFCSSMKFFPVPDSEYWSWKYDFKKQQKRCRKKA